MYWAPKNAHSSPVVPARRPLLAQLWDEGRLHCLALLLCIGATMAPNPHLALQHLQARLSGFTPVSQPLLPSKLLVCSVSLADLA